VCVRVPIPCCMWQYGGDPPHINYSIGMANSLLMSGNCCGSPTPASAVLGPDGAPLVSGGDGGVGSVWSRLMILTLAAYRCRLCAFFAFNILQPRREWGEDVRSEEVGGEGDANAIVEPASAKGSPKQNERLHARVPDPSNSNTHAHVVSNRHVLIPRPKHEYQIIRAPSQREAKTHAGNAHQVYIQSERPMFSSRHKG
jgi:hypothetical protein